MAEDKDRSAVLKGSVAAGWRSRESILFVVLAAIMLTSAIVAELIAVKLFQVPFYGWLGIDRPFTLTCGSLLWPIVFITTDTINEFYGRFAVRFVSWLTVAMIVVMFLVTNISIKVPAAPFSSVDDPTFATVFGQGTWIMVGSIAAFLISQLVDVVTFHRIRRWLKGRHIWARATGSTLLSQLVDSFVVIYIAFHFSGKNTAEECWNISVSSYMYKVGLALGMTPVIYFAHWLVVEWLGKDTAERLAEGAARDSS